MTDNYEVGLWDIGGPHGRQITCGDEVTSSFTPGWRGIAVGDCVVTGRYDLMTVVPSHNRSIGHVINLSRSVIDLEDEPQST